MNLRVLIVDDDEIQNEVISILVANLGHQISQAFSGREALELFAREAPDIVLLDYELPDVQGTGVLKQIRSLEGEHWHPVLMISAHDEAQIQIDCLNDGADDYLVKPINMPLLHARVGALRRLALMQNRLSKQAQQLRQLLDHVDQENAAAHYLFERLVSASGAQIPGVDQWLQSAEKFSGDLMATSTGPNGHIYLLIADGTGHGLAAALGLIPISQTFHAMSRKGHPIATIAREMNRQLRHYAPTHRFVAAVLLELKPQERSLDIWNGGMPTPLLLDAQHQVVAECRSRHVPLGLLGGREFSADIQHIALQDGQWLICTSDGAQEAQNPQGEFFGAERWRALLTQPGTVISCAAIRAHLQNFLAGKSAHDDIAVMVIDCDQLLQVCHPDAVPAGSRPMQPCSYELRLALAQLGEFELVPAAVEWLQRLGCPPQLVARAHTVLMELTTNAIDHGLLQLDSRLKLSPEGFEHYYVERQSRLANGGAGSLLLRIAIDCEAHGGRLRIHVEDSGAGFDVAAVLSAPVSDNPHAGRGIRLVQSLCQELAYSPTGNSVEAVLLF